MRDKLNERLEDAQSKKVANATLMSRDNYNDILKRVIELQTPGLSTMKKDYYYLKKYEILETTVNNTTVRKLKKNSDQLFVYTEKLFDVISNVHLAKGHVERDVMEKEISNKYANIALEYITMYLQLCETCQLKKSSTRKPLVVKPIVSAYTTV